MTRVTYETVDAVDALTAICQAHLHPEKFEEAKIFLAELRKREEALGIDDSVWEAAREVFGGSVLNENGRTHKILHARCQRALHAWDQRFGPLNDEQTEYATSLLIWAVRKGDGVAKPYPLVYDALDRIGRDDRVVEAFETRAGDQVLRENLSTLVTGTDDE